MKNGQDTKIDKEGMDNLVAFFKLLFEMDKNKTQRIIKLKNPLK